MAKPAATAAPTAGPSTPRVPKFAAFPPREPCPLSTPSDTWVTPLAAPAYFPLSAFLAVTRELTLHPERNSALILRADPLDPAAAAHTAHAARPDDAAEGARLGLELVDDVRVRLMPRQPQRDRKLDQRTLFFRTPEVAAASADGTERAESGRTEQALVVKIPLVGGVNEIPWFHPPVRKLAFHWRAFDPAADGGGGAADGGAGGGADGEAEADADERADAHGVALDRMGTISVSYLPFPGGVRTNSDNVDSLGVPVKAARKRSPLAGPAAGVAAAAEMEAGTGAYGQDVRGGYSDEAARYRLERTCLALLERLHKFGAGTYLGYAKRVHHDVVVSREPFQDLYLVLKDRHRHLESRAQKPGSKKVEDVKRHVFKDVAIAAFLMLLWKDMYPARQSDGVLEWDSWGRPEGGFIDLGCGNGLLVHILVSEGYAGVGYELRQRRTWPLYPPKTQAALVELPIDMPSWFPESMAEWDAGEWAGRSGCVLKDDSFLIGNHADELIPWLPLLSLLPRRPVPHLSLPCCLHKLDSMWTPSVFRAPEHAHAPPRGFGDGLEEGESRYKAYVMWLGWCGLMCGWEWEREALRIPSTRGWAIVARRRWADDGETRACRAWALEQVSEVRRRGAFQVRVKEGKDH